MNLEPLANLTAQTAAQNLVLKELCAVLFAELAMTDQNPRARLGEMLTDEQGAVYGAVVAGTDGPVDTGQVLALKDTFRRELFTLSQRALERMLRSRGR